MAKPKSKRELPRTSTAKQVEALRSGPGQARVHDEGEKTYDESPPKPKGFDPKR